MLALTVRLICLDLISDRQTQRLTAVLQEERFEHAVVRQATGGIELVLFLRETPGDVEGLALAVVQRALRTVVGQAPYTVAGSALEDAGSLASRALGAARGEVTGSGHGSEWPAENADNPVGDSAQ